MVNDAATLTESCVAGLGRRLRHVRTVARRADELSVTVPGVDRDMLVAAAWLHDIGYAPEVGSSGFHPLDGARYLRDAGWPRSVVNLVAHHSGTRYEAAERGLSDQLSVFPFREPVLSDALCAADLTTGPDGQLFTFDERVEEILSRYVAGDPVHRTWSRIRPVMAAVVARVERRLADGQSTVG